MTSLEEAPMKLSDLFDGGWKMFRGIEDSLEETKSLQSQIEECIKTFVRCTHMVNTLGLYSTNETFNEVSTDNVRFLLLPAFLGELHAMAISNDNRKTFVQTSKIYFCDFLKRCGEYDITKKNLKRYLKKADEKRPSVEEMNATRDEKIQRYKENKEITKKTRLMQNRLEKNPESVHDDEKRELYTDCIKLWINKAIENVQLLEGELSILEQMSQIKIGKVKPPEQKSNLQPMKPFLITRESIKKQVFGAGYKSLPTMTEAEYFEKELKEGKIVTEYKDKPEVKIDDDDVIDDEEKLAKERAWDEFKDSHRRGEGNKDRHG